MPGDPVTDQIMRSIWCSLVLVTGLAGQSAGQRSEFEAGRTAYQAGEFKRAAIHFQLAVHTNPSDAECNYWVGRSYETLADIAQPFGGRYHAEARAYLTKAVDLAPGRTDYRQELFAFLVDSGDFSRGALRQAQSILIGVPESDPDYAYMLQDYRAATREHSSAAARLGRAFLAIPNIASRVVTVVHSPDEGSPRSTGQ